MKRFIGIFLLIALPAWGQVGHPEAAASLAARDAFAQGDRATLARALAAQVHPDADGLLQAAAEFRNNILQAYAWTSARMMATVHCGSG